MRVPWRSNREKHSYHIPHIEIVPTNNFLRPQKHAHIQCGYRTQSPPSEKRAEFEKITCWHPIDTLDFLLSSPLKLFASSTKTFLYFQNSLPFRDARLEFRFHSLHHPISMPYPRSLYVTKVSSLDHPHLLTSQKKC